MANEVLVGLKIGAAVSGSLQAAFGTARSTVQQLGRATDGLSLKQKALGDLIHRQMGTLAPSSLAALNRDYEKLGRTIDQLKVKQERLTASIARGEALKEHRADLRGQMMETAGTGAVLGAPVVQAMRTSIDFKDQVRDIAITGDFDAAEEQRLSQVMRGAALKWNQTQSEVARGTAVLIAGGISNAQELARYAPVMAKTATATRASMDDLGSVAIALKDNLGIGAGGLERSMNMLAYAGKRGQFELADMAKWLPQLTPQFAALGITGERAVAEIGASLQIALRGAGSNDEAANNFKNFLGKITAPDTIKDFSKAGIDLQAGMRRLVGEGLTPVQAMLQLITQYMGSKGPAAASEFQKAMALKDAQEREAALQRLNEAYKLGELFQDMQAMSFIRPAVANQADMADIQKGSMDAADKGVLDADWKKRMGSPKEELKALMISVSDLGLSVGGVLLPALVDVVQAAVPVVQQFSAWAAENPALIKGVISLVAGLLVGKMAILGVAYGANLAISPLVGLATAYGSISAKWTLLRGMLQAGRFAPLISGLKMAGQAVLWLGRALMLNPIGLLITGIAVAAFLIYRYWEPIKGFFGGLWTEIKAGFSGGLAGILGLLVNFSPLGLFYRAFAGVMSYFGVELPGKFSEFGSMVISGLVSGMTAKLSAARDTVVSFGNSIKGWFTETLGIHSPSRVFMGYGANVGEGAAIGISGSEGLVRKAALGMAAATAVNFAAPNLAAATAVPGAAGMAGGGITIHYAPQITVQGGGPGTQDAVQQALQLSRNDLEKMMREVLADQQRRAF